MAQEVVRTSSDFRPEQGAVFDLSSRAKLRIVGADRLRYLNGQITNDLRKASGASAIHACVLSAKGKINAEVFIAAEGEAFLVDTDPGMGDQLAARLERYIIADDVQIEDLTEEFALFHVIGANVPALADGQKHRQVERFGIVGTDVWMSRAERDSGLQVLSQTFSICEEGCAETFRIERGLPRWGRELTDEIIPTEANLEASAIDFAKGCYIGQEVISRIKMSGQTNKRLCGLLPESQVPLTPGMRLMTTEEKKDVGWVTSAVMSGRLGRQIALGFLKRGFQTPGVRLCAVSEEPVLASPLAVTVVSLPFL